MSKGASTPLRSASAVSGILGPISPQADTFAEIDLSWFTFARSSLKNRSVSEIGVQRGQRDGPVWLNRRKQEIEGRPPPALAGNTNVAADPPHECAYVRQSQTIAFLTLGRATSAGMP
jgi:hypothetical protein